MNQRRFRPVTADVVNPARIVAAVANDNHTVDAIAAYLGVNHSAALLRTTLTQMVDDGQLDADDSETRRFTLPWESAPSLDDPHYESEMTLRAMQDDRAATEQDPDCGCTSSNGDKYCELHGETPGY